MTVGAVDVVLLLVAFSWLSVFVLIVRTNGKLGVARKVLVEAEALLSAPLPDPEVPSRFPPVVRDISLVFGAETPAQAVFDAISAEKPAIVRQVRLFSLYRGAGLPSGSKSLAFRVVMQDTERTLTDAEADAARDALVALLGRRFSAKLRT